MLSLPALCHNREKGSKKMSIPQAILWDMDGTLLNTLEDLRDSVNASLADCGFSPRSLEEIRSFVGNGVTKLLERSLPPEADSKQLARVHELFRDYYEQNCQNKTQPYPGIVELLRQLKQRGVAMAVVSNKPEAATQRLNRYYFGQLIPVAVGAQPGLNRKPAPDMPLLALKLLNAQPQHSLLIGDSETDIACARNTGLRCISVTWGFREREFLLSQGADCVINSPAELARLWGL